MRTKSILTILVTAALGVATGSTYAADMGTYEEPTAQIDDEDIINPDEKVYFGWSGTYLPECDSRKAQRAVSRQIARAVPSYYDGRKIKLMEDIHESEFIIGQPSPVARRYCNGVAILTDDTRHRIYYALVQYDGFLGISWSVKACIDGLDKFRVYDGQCRTVRPEQEIIPR
ncbi:hypothetical protein PsAD2_00887 [Pseudovibrio axinellae]|uniref:Uncharacterized protein n=1 Tax=Pseudovibrio axinellae TaxID=989403 RepID=A0A166AV38_9HYPH|nr:hypothetical protein [Pseudovibrio axinellae]KZL21588.1 hypothetical protein PsAD2_00887 [Pseudovibrio axinellae]SER10696.1 hypothetical protein SAMN05421798_106158 [Pseudovibrio axinellae]